MDTTAGDNTAPVGPAEDTLLTTQEAAALMRLSEETIRRHARIYQRTKGKSGLRTLQRKGHAHYRFSKADLFRCFGGDAPLKQPRGRAA
jgi:hypothetical protein